MGQHEDEPFQYDDVPFEHDDPVTGLNRPAEEHRAEIKKMLDEAEIVPPEELDEIVRRPTGTDEEASSSS